MVAPPNLGQLAALQGREDEGIVVGRVLDVAQVAHRAFDISAVLELTMS